MKTTRLYQKDPYLTSNPAGVLSIKTEGNRLLLIPDQSVFFPTAGGQPCDLGTLSFGDLNLPVVDVYEDGESVVHVIELGPEAGADLGSGHDAKLPRPGDEITLSIDWKRRFDNMQRHAGEHILSGAFHRLFGGVNKGFHMGEDHITIDILIPETDGRMDWEMATAAENEANKVIAEDLPITVTYFDSGEDARKFPLRKELAIEEDVSVVTVGDVSDPADCVGDMSGPADCVACCGTHPSSSGQIGLLKIYKIEPNKGMTRIYFEAGGRALTNYQKQFDIMYDIGNRLSTGIYELPERLDAMQRESDQLHEKLKAFRSKVISHESSDILAELSEAALSGSSASFGVSAAASGVDFPQSLPGDSVTTCIRRYSDFSIDDLLALAKEVQNGSIPSGSIPSGSGGQADPVQEKTSPYLLALVHQPTNTVLLSSGTISGAGSDENSGADSGSTSPICEPIDCGAIVKEHALPLGGRGGGKATSARAMFQSPEDLEQFLASLPGPW